MMKANSQDHIETRFLEALRHHLEGWRLKIENDFSQRNFAQELRNLQSDPVYAKLSLATPEYVLIRLMGRISISIGRRIGEIYDKIPRLVAAARFGLTPDQIAPKLSGLELDIGLRYSLLSEEDVTHLARIVETYFGQRSESGVGIEIRYNFNPNDSARLRKDCDMASYLENEGLLPVYLVFSSISPRDDAIARLARAGWHFRIGDEAISFTRALLGLDFAEILDKPYVKTEIDQEVGRIMTAMVNSYAFQTVVRAMSPPS